MRLSVVVTIVDAGRALERCLTALATQQGSPDVEVIVPWDDTVPGIPDLSRRFPAFRFLALGGLATERGAHTAAGQHELFDRRRAAGLRQAGGDVIAMLEDRGVPTPDWARTMIRLHEALPHAVIGGAVDNGRDGLLQWAVYYCDFHRYQRPFAAGGRGYASDVNIGYKRRALEATADLWRTEYRETTVNWALLRAGETLYVTPELRVEQHREHLTLAALVAERFAWGRLFARTRARETSRARRAVLTLSSPLLPVLLMARHVRLQAVKRVRPSAFLRAAPVLFGLLAAWSVGEAAGYLTADP